MNKTIRLWDGPKVIGLLSVDQLGGSSFQGSTGGASNSSVVDIEMDPFAGLIVDHGTRNSPIDWREEQQ